MANFDLSVYVTGQTKLDNFYKDAEMRTIDPVVLRFVLSTTGIMLPNFAELKHSEARPIKANFLTRQSRTLGTGGRIFNHTGAQAVSATQDFTWLTYDDTFASTLKQNNNNIFTMDESEANKLQNVAANFATDLEKKASDFIVANRTGVNIATVEGTFNGTTDVFVIDAATNEDRAMQITKTVMHLNKYSRFRYVVICDSVAFDKFEFAAAQGAQNSTNLSFQYQGVQYIHDINLSASAAAIDATYIEGFWNIVPEGAVSALPWIPQQNRNGHVGSDSMYGNITDPLTGLTLAAHTYEERGNGTSRGGNTQDIIFESEFSVDIALNTNPLTTADETSIFAFALLT
jgi:hypothetical protein